MLNLANTLTVLIIPLIACLKFNIFPSAALFLNTFSFLIIGKLISYMHVMKNVRSLALLLKENPKLDSKTAFVEFVGENQLTMNNYYRIEKGRHNVDYILNWRDFAYFMMAPTLCFQFEYPRNKTIRKWWLTKRIIELFIVMSLIVILWL